MLELATLSASKALCKGDPVDLGPLLPSSCERARIARPTARVGWTNRTHTVTMPLNFLFPESVREVSIRRDGESTFLTTRPSDCSGIRTSWAKASADFMADACHLLVLEHSF